MDSDALDRLEAAKAKLKDQPDDWEFLDDKLQACLDLRRFRDALEVTEHMIRLWPSRAGALYNHAGVLLELNRQKEAIEFFNKAIEAKPDMIIAHIELANAYWELNQFDKAEASLKAALKIDPQNKRALDRLAPVLGEQEKYVEAVELCRQIIAQHPDDARAYVNLGVALHGQNDLFGASQAYAKSELLDPDRATTHYNHGRLLYEMGDLDQAASKFQKAAELDSKDPDAVGYLVRIYERTEQPEQEMQALLELLKREPTSAWAQSRLCALALEQNDFQEIERRARFGLEHDPANHTLLHYLGMALCDRDSYDEAVQIFKKAIEAEPTDFGTRYEYALALVGANRIPQACAQLERVLAACTDPDLTAAAEERLAELRGPR